MYPSTNAKVRYVQEGRYFTVKFSGKINKRKLAYRINTLRNCVMCNIKNSKVIKVLLDIRKIQFDSGETHFMMGRMLVKGLMELESHGYTAFRAVLNDHYEGKVSENRADFTNKRDAINWLSSR
jgi:hypothetical protein